MKTNVPKNATGDHKKIIIIVLAVIVLIAIVAAVIFNNTGKKKKRTTIIPIIQRQFHRPAKQVKHLIRQSLSVKQLRRLRL